MQDTRRALTHLKKIPILKDLSRDDLVLLAEDATLQEIRRRRVVYMPGDPGASVYMISSGRVKISRVTSDGKELTLAYRSSGDLFGELSLLDAKPREEMAETTDDTTVVQITRKALERVVAADGALAFAVMREMMERRRALERKIEDLVFKDVNSKLAELLLKLAKSHGVNDDRGTLLAMKITHQEMANLIGSTRETVSLALSQFKRKKLIATESRRVIVTDREGLKALI